MLHGKGPTSINVACSSFICDFWTSGMQNEGDYGLCSNLTPH